MTATPIPRTLSLAMSGMRDLVHYRNTADGTFTDCAPRSVPYDEAVIKKRLENELARNGQVFYVHNRVQSLQTRLHFLQQLMPGLSIGVVHGQMSGPAIGASAGIYPSEASTVSSDNDRRIGHRYSHREYADRGRSRRVWVGPTLSTAAAAWDVNAKKLSATFSIHRLFRSLRTPARGWHARTTELGSGYRLAVRGYGNSRCGKPIRARNSTASSPLSVSICMPSFCRMKCRGSKGKNPPKSFDFQIWIWPFSVFAG